MFSISIILGVKHQCLVTIYAMLPFYHARIRKLVDNRLGLAGHECDLALP